MPVGHRRALKTHEFDRNGSVGENIDAWTIADEDR